MIIGCVSTDPAPFPQVSPKPRTLDSASFSPFSGKTKVADKAGISYTVRGEENMSLLDLSALEQIVEVGQTRFINEVSIFNKYLDSDLLLSVVDHEILSTDK